MSEHPHDFGGLGDSPATTPTSIPNELGDDPFAVIRQSSERVFEGSVWDIRRDIFDYGDSTIARDYVDHTGAVAILALDPQDRVLLIKQYRHPIGMRDWEIPAGLLDIGASRRFSERNGNLPKRPISSRPNGRCSATSSPLPAAATRPSASTLREA